MDGYYYLHTNGELIYKRALDGIEADFRESDFVRMFWPCGTTNRQDAWTILVEASALNANPQRISELTKKWGCSDDDARIYADRIKAKVFKDGDKFCATRRDFINIQESPCGFGDTILQALSELARALGFAKKHGKTWGASFEDLLNP